VAASPGVAAGPNVAADTGGSIGARVRSTGDVCRSGVARVRLDGGDQLCELQVELLMPRQERLQAASRMGELAALAGAVAAQPLEATDSEVEEPAGELLQRRVVRLLGRLQERARGVPVRAALELAGAQPEAGAGAVGARRPLVVLGRRAGRRVADFRVGAYFFRGLLLAKSSAIWSNVAQRMPSCLLMCSMIRSCIASTCGRPETSGWIVIANTA